MILKQTLESRYNKENNTYNLEGLTEKYHYNLKKKEL